MVGGPVESELATPTGVSILVNLVDEAVSFYPPIKPRAVGYGAGAKDFAGVPNVLRIVVGEPLDYGLLRDEVAVIETNIDDVTGEVVGHVIEKILREGARDVSILPAFMKKGRPGHIVKVIADLDDAERLSRILMEETGSLGVRVYPCGRRILLRRSIPVEVEVGGVKATVSVKVAKDSRGRRLNPSTRTRRDSPRRPVYP
ncbi:LarC family nickel insertion protein [Candidatus Bathyarchaeota archaeon]|nr:MAG: LarC family nickel insertion protein [Candidatus Bathyarchaeota archaeon]